MNMIKIKTGNLIGPQLDWAVAMAGEEWKTAHKHFPTMTLTPNFDSVVIRPFPTLPSGDAIACVLEPLNPMRQGPQVYEPSLLWSFGGPIIERENIELRYTTKIVDDRTIGYIWVAKIGLHYMAGDTALIAAMRAFVAGKLGNEIEVPEV